MLSLSVCAVLYKRVERGLIQYPASPAEMFTLLLLLTSTIVCEEMVKIRWRDPSDMDIGLKQENSSVTVHCNVPLKKAKLGPRWVSDTFCSFTGKMASEKTH